MEQFTGSNSDSYTGQGKIWEIAKRFNQTSKKIQGSVTCVRRRKVSKDKHEPVGVL
jgi:hypothetical protein